MKVHSLWLPCVGGRQSQGVASPTGSPYATGSTSRLRQCFLLVSKVLSSIAPCAVAGPHDLLSTSVAAATGTFWRARSSSSTRRCLPRRSPNSLPIADLSSLVTQHCRTGTWRCAHLSSLAHGLIVAAAVEKTRTGRNSDGTRDMQIANEASIQTARKRSPLHAQRYENEHAHMHAKSNL